MFETLLSHDYGLAFWLAWTVHGDHDILAYGASLGVCLLFGLVKRIALSLGGVLLRNA